MAGPNANPISDFFCLGWDPAFRNVLDSSHCGQVETPTAGPLLPFSSRAHDEGEALVLEGETNCVKVGIASVLLLLYFVGHLRVCR